MKCTETRKDGQVELRIRAGQADVLVIISAKGGWKYGTREYPSFEGRKHIPWGTVDTSPFNVRLSMNGVAMLSKQDWDDITHLIDHTIEREMTNVAAG